MLILTNNLFSKRYWQRSRIIFTSTDATGLKFSDSLSFGHGLSSGFFNDAPVIVAGNRADSLALEIFTINDLSKGLVNRIVIEEDAGPTQTQVFPHESIDYILSANQRKSEVALYTGTLD